MQEKTNGRKPARRLSASSQEEKASFTLRLYPELLREIETVLESIPKRRRPYRNDYIAQAIEERVKRDQKRLGITALNNTQVPTQNGQVSPAEKRLEEDNLL